MLTSKTLGFLFVFSGFAIAETSIHWKNISDNSEGSGFYDSSFNYDRTSPQASVMRFCFIGRLENVCSIIAQTAQEMQKAYTNGAHESMEILSCREGDKRVTTQYLLHDDYNTRELNMTQTIMRCES